MKPGPASTATSDDDALIAGHLRGDPGALEALFCRYRDPAYRVAFRLLGNAEDALDSVQDGFIKALSRIQGFEHRSSFKTWLLRIVTNSALDIGRQRRRRTRLSESIAERSVWDREASSNRYDPSREIEASDLRTSVSNALLRLPEAQRQAFVLYVEGELTYREIAEMLEISIGTVMSRLFYARQKLRDILAVSVPV